VPLWNARWLFKSADERGWKSDLGLIVAADFEAAGRLSKELHDCGYTCTVARRSEGLRAVEGARPHFVVLDHDPSDLDGWSLLSRIGERTAAPIIVVADESPGDSTVVALGLGASAFLVRPVSEEELCLRVSAALRRSSLEPREVRSIDDNFFQLDLIRERAAVLELELDLTPTEFRLLAALARHPGAALGHDRILELVWPDGFRELDQVKLNVSYLRRAVRAVAPIDPIETVPGIGYRYEPRRID
jgi:two-component system, OmpR family, KDP operon response regulator KdpE